MGVEQIADELEEDIALGRLHPRERLTEDALMERFAAKRHVIRSVLTVLESRGAVERRPNVGALVRALTAREVRELYDVRALVEGACVRAIRMPVEAGALAAIETARRDHEQAVGARDRRTALRANLRFHELLFGLAPNRLLVEAVAHYARMASPVRSITVVDDRLLERARDEHLVMVRALRAGDVEGLARACADHLLPSREAYLRLLGD